MVSLDKLFNMFTSSFCYDCISVSWLSIFNVLFSHLTNPSVLYLPFDDSSIPCPPSSRGPMREERSCSVVSDSLQPHRLQPTRLLRPWDIPSKSTGVGCHCLKVYFSSLVSIFYFLNSSSLMVVPHLSQPQTSERILALSHFTKNLRQRVKFKLNLSNNLKPKILYNQRHL